MSINPLLNAISSALAQQSVSRPIKSTASPSGVSTRASASVADSSPPQAVLQNAGLINASASLAQLSSLLEVAEAGTQQIGAILERLQSLAQQANGGNIDFAAFNSEFQQLLAQIDRIVNGTTFGGTKLLSGALFGRVDSEEQSLSLPDLSIAGLFGMHVPDILTSQRADLASALLMKALSASDKAKEAIAGIFGQLNFAAASVDSALANSAAASSILGESDLAEGENADAFAVLLSHPIAVQAQTGNISPGLLSLLQE